MKRFISIVAALLAFGLAASAQLKVTHEFEKTEKIATARLGFVRLEKSGDRVYMTLPSSNKFDDTELFWLGKTVHSAAQTLADIVDLFDTLEEAVKVQDAFGKDVLISKMGGNLYFHFEIQAGQRFLSKAEAKKLLNALQVLEWTIDHPEVTDNP